MTWILASYRIYKRGFLKLRYASLDFVDKKTTTFAHQLERFTHICEGIAVKQLTSVLLCLALEDINKYFRFVTHVQK